MCEVAITGMGVVSPLGVGLEAFQRGMAEERTLELESCTALDGTPMEGWPISRIPGLEEATRSLPAKLRKYMSQAAVLGCLAGREAWEHSCIQDRVRPERIALFGVSGLTAAQFENAPDLLGNCVDASGEFSEKLLGLEGLSRMNPLDSFRLLPNMPPCLLAMLLGIQGPNLILNPFEDQTAYALQEGVRAIAMGDVDAALVGAADTPSSPSSLVYLHQNGQIQAGEVASPSAVYFVLERAEAGQAQVREQARISLEPKGNAKPWQDPLAPRLGRTFAVSPLFALLEACLGSRKPLELPGIEVNLEGQP